MAYKQASEKQYYYISKAEWKLLGLIGYCSESTKGTFQARPQGVLKHISTV